MSRGFRISDIDKNNSVLWSLANNPTQKNYGLRTKEVINNLKILYLLTGGNIIVSASCYFESPITTEVTNRLKDWFENGEILYFIDDDLDNVVEHGQKKIEKSPRSFSVYQNKKDILIKSKQLDAWGNILKRPTISISDKIVNFWIDDVSSIEPDTIGFSLKKRFHSSQDELSKYQIRLIDFAKNREKDFVWEYIEPFLRELNLHDNAFHQLVKTKLAIMYALATAEVLGVNIDDYRITNKITEASKFDPVLFSRCLNQIGVLETILSLGNNQLMQLKYSTEFSAFKELYFLLIENFTTDNLMLRSLDVLYKFEEFYVKSDSKDYFIKKFTKFCKLYNLPKENYKQPLSFIKDNFEHFSNKILFDFKCYADSFVQDREKKENLADFETMIKLIKAKKTAKKYLLISLIIILYTIIISLLSYFKGKQYALLLIVPSCLGLFFRSYVKVDLFISAFKTLFFNKEYKKLKEKIK